MKKIFFSICIIFTIFSCSKKDNNLYSCNPTINEKVKKTRTENQSITRTELAEKEIEEQFAIFRSLTNENKLRIYKEKINYLLENNKYTSKEIGYLTYIKNSTLASIYDMDSISLEQLNLYNINYQRDSLGWSDLEIVSSLETWLTEEELIEFQKPGTGGGGGGGGSTPDCMCRKNLWCDFSGISGYECKWGGCKAKGGCGWIGTSDCKGRCVLL